MQARGRTHQAQRYRGGGSDGCSRGRWLMQWANMLRLCSGYKALAYGWTPGTGALSRQTTDGHRGQLCAASEWSGIEIAVEVSEEGA